MIKIRKEKREKLLTMVVWLVVLIISYSLAAWVFTVVFSVLKSLVKGLAG